MTDTFLHKGFGWLSTKLNDLTSVDATYTAGSSSLSVKVIIGKTSQDIIVQQDVGVGSSYFDFIIKTSYLSSVEPTAGHTITVDDRDFEVVNQLDGRCYVYTDSTFTTYRIHTQLI